MLRSVDRSRARIAAAGFGAVLIAFFVVAPKSQGGPPLRDFESYYSAGATWHYQGDPYGREVWRTERTIPGIVTTHDELLPFVGPPYGLPLWSAMSRLPWFGAVFTWQVVLALSIAAIAFGSLRLAGGRLHVLDACAVLIFCAGFGPLTSGTALGQVAIVATAAIVLLPQLLAPRLMAAAFLAALVAALQPNLALVLGALLGTRRSTIALVTAAIVAIGGSALALAQTGGLHTYAAVLAAHSEAERFITIQTTPSAVARTLGAGPALAGAIGTGIAAVVVIAVLAQWLARRYSPVARLALACAALPLATPFSHEHDFTIAFLPAILVARTARGAAWAIGACATMLVAIDWLGLSQRPTGVLATTFLTLGAALALASLSRGTLRPYHGVPLGASLGVLIVGLVVSRRPLPTWPVALPANFHVPPAVGAPMVWHLEQVASGIATLAPQYGLLRLLSLVGCAALWLVASVVLVERRASRPQRDDASLLPPTIYETYPPDPIGSPA